MSRFKGLAVLLTVSVFLGSASGCSGSSAGTESVDVPDETEQTIEDVVRPQDDFYRYVNGETLANAVYDYGHSIAVNASDDSLVREQLRGIITEVAEGSGYSPNTEEYAIQQIYNLYIDYDFANAEVPQELDQLFHEIDEAESVEQLLLIDAEVTRDYGCGNLLGLLSGPNYFGYCDDVLSFKPYEEVIDIDLTSLYSDTSPLNGLRDRASLCLQAIGHSKEEGDEYGTSFAYIVYELSESSDPELIGHQLATENFELYSFDQAASILSNIDLGSYLDTMGLVPSDYEEFGVYDPEQLAGLNSILTEENLNGLKAWEITRIADFFGPFVYNGYEELNDYARLSTAPVEEQVISTIINNYGLLYDPIYVEQYYSEEIDNAVRSMCDDIKEEYRELISQAEWLTEGTREELLTKLDNIIYVTGTDLHRTDASELSTLEYDDYFDFCRSYNAFLLRRSFNRLSGTIDRSEVMMSMSSVNAAYSSSANSICICVASTNPPFFDINDDYYSNLGGLGATIAHEMGHAFDSDYIVFDSDGIYDPSWIPDEDMNALLTRNESAVRYFEDNFVMFGIYHVDGEMTLGENYADLGGLECIARIPETDEQMETMFEAYARSWCLKMVDESFVNQIASDVHSPAWLRVNGMLSTLNEFYETYDVAEGDGMYIAPENRISRWY